MDVLKQLKLSIKEGIGEKGNPSAYNIDHHYNFWHI